MSNWLVIILSSVVALLIGMWRDEHHMRKHAERMWKHHESQHDYWRQASHNYLVLRMRAAEADLAGTTLDKHPRSTDG